MTTTRKQGQRLPQDLRSRGMQMLRDGHKGPDVEHELGVSSSTTSRWRTALKQQDRPTKPKTKKPKPTMATSYLAKQLEIISKMIRDKLPELARFTLTADSDGKAQVEYAVRQTTLVSGTVKL